MITNKNSILLLLDEVLEQAPNTAKETDSIEDWDSLNILSLIALADESFNKSITMEEFDKSKTIADIINLLQS